MTLIANNPAPKEHSWIPSFSGNIFLKMQEALLKQKNEVQPLSRFAALGSIELKNELYAQGMKAYEEAVSQISKKVEELKKEIEAKKNSSPSIWETIGGTVLDVAAGIAIGAMFGPIGMAVGATSAGTVSFAASYFSGNKNGFILSGIKKMLSSDSEEQLKALEVEAGREKANLERQKATQHQNEISMVLKTEVEPQEAIRQAVSNIITAIMKMFAQTANAQGRG